MIESKQTEAPTDLASALIEETNTEDSGYASEGRQCDWECRETMNL